MSQPASSTSWISPPGARRYSDQKFVRSLRNHRLPSASQTGWKTDSPFPPATTVSVPSAVRTTSWAASHGMSGWFHCSQASVVPSGERRASETKSGPETSTSVASAATRTSSLTTSAGRSPSAWVSRTASRPSEVTRKSAWRTPAGSSGSGVTATGASLPASSRYSRWSTNSVNHRVPSCTVHEPPPYSCTRVRAFQGAGRTSVTVPSADRRTITDLPPSLGRDSDHQTSSPSTHTSPSRAAARTTSSEVIGVDQLPWGSLPGVSGVMSVTLGPRRSDRDTSPDLPDPRAEGDYRPTHACPHHVDAPTGVRSESLRFDGCEQEAAGREAPRQPASREEEVARPVRDRRRGLEPARPRR